MPSQPESIAAFAEPTDPSEATLLVVNRTEPVPLLGLLEEAFARQPVHVVERAVPGPIEDLVLLLDEDGVAAGSSLQDLAASFLLINADRYRTGANDLDEGAVPDVLRELTEIGFELRGYPASAKEKLLLIAMSRFVEARALDVGAGELRVGFQRIARLDDEHGTRQVYERLADSPVETHVYGADVGSEAIAALPDSLHAHAADDEEYRRSWFLVFEPPETEAGAEMALVAWEVGDNVWEGNWTFSPARTRRIGEYVRTSL